VKDYVLKYLSSPRDSRMKEKALAGERDDIKKECVKEIKQYLEELNAK
jgi:hypothetical protein